jgi:hypothetical protein
MAEVLLHNPYLVVVVLDQGSNLESISINVANGSAEVILDSEICRTRMENK